MTSQMPTNPRSEVNNYLRRACESRMHGGDLPARPAAWDVLHAEELPAAGDTLAALSLLPGDWLAASLLASRARAVCEQAGWPELARLARCIELLPSLELSKAQAQRRRIDPGEIYSRNSERLQAMLESEVRNNPGHDNMMTMLMVHRHLDAARERAANLFGREVWFQEQDTAGELADSELLIARLDALRLAASDAGLGVLAREAAERMLAELAESVKAAVRLGDWRSAARLRGRYLLIWHEIAPGNFPDRYPDDTPLLLSNSRKMGEVIGVMHSKNVVHGTLLLESFSPDISIKNFGDTKLLEDAAFNAALEERISELLAEVGPGEQISPERLEALAPDPANAKQYGLDNPHADAFVEDLIPLWHQLSPARWKSFTQGYISVEGYPAAAKVAELVSKRTAGNHLGNRGGELPYTPLQVPHFAIRAAGYALRHFAGDGAVVTSLTLDEIVATEDLAMRLSQLVTFLVETWQVAPAAHREGVEQLFSEMEELREHGDTEQATDTRERATCVLKRCLSPTQYRRFIAYTNLARADAAADDDEASRLLSDAAGEFIALGDYAHALFACDLISEALARARQALTMGAVIVKSMSQYVGLASTYREESFLDLALAASAQTPPFFLSEEHSSSALAYDLYARAIRADTNLETQQKLLCRVIAICERYPALDSLKDKASVQVTPTSSNEDGDGQELQPSPQVRAFLAQHNWPAAASVLLNELTEMKHREAPSASGLGMAAIFANTLQNCSDYLIHQRALMAQDLAEVVSRYAPVIFAERERAGSQSQKRKLANRANTLGWASVHFSHFTGQDGQLLDPGIKLLELAVSLTPKETVPQSFSSYANNLALGYRARAGRTDRDDAKTLLERAVELMRDVAEVDEALSKSSDPYDRTVGATAYLDHLNLGLTYHDLARRTYDATWISKKPQDSARWYGLAAEAFTKSRELSALQDRPDNAGTASNNLALLFIHLCEHFILERTWAGGDVQRAFYDWLCVVAGAEISTATFLDLCAQSALANAVDGARIGLTGNPALLIESVSSQLQLWSLFSQHPTLAPDVARHSLITLLELFDEMRDASIFERYGEEVAELSEMQGILEALFRVEFCQYVTQGAGDAQAAHAAFTKLSRTGNAVARAVAAPRLQWFELQQGKSEVVVNGLYLGASAGGLELRIPSQRRHLSLYGVEVKQVGFAVRDASWMRDSAAMLAARMESAMTLEDLPPALLTGKVVGALGGAPLIIEATRLPIASWDAWALELNVEQIGTAVIKPSLPYVGMYDSVSGSLSTEFPAVLAQTGQSLIFGQQGMTLEVTLPFTVRTGSRDEYVTVSGTIDEPEIELNTCAVVLALKTAPRITSADVSYLVKSDRTEAALCCAASYDLTSPSVSFPAPILNTYAPLFFFDQEIPEGAFAMLKELNPHEVMLVGLPDDTEAAHAMLGDLFDPRREIFILIEESEREQAAEALAVLNRSIHSSIGGAYLLRATAPRTRAASNEAYDPLDNIQVIVVPRKWTLTAAQMLWDLAAIRRLSVEDVPTIGESGVTFVNIKGNPFETRLRSTLFKGIVPMEELIDRYCEMMEEPLGRMVLQSPDAPANTLKLAAPSIPRRPIFLVPNDPLAAIAAIPYVRQLGALALPPDDDSLALLERLRPSKIYASQPDAGRIPEADWVVSIIPNGALQLTREYQSHVKQDYQQTLDGLARTHPHLLPSRQLLEEMQPADYVVLCMNSEAERPWAYLAANYAAAIHAPLLLAEIKATFPPEATRTSGSTVNRLSEELSALPSRFSENHRSRHLRPVVNDKVSGVPRNDLGETYETLLDMNPTYLGFISSEAALPIELMGVPPLATRFAVGRLSGPDLTSTSLLITRAALGEDVERPATIRAVVVDCADALRSQPLPGVRREVEAIYRILDAEREIRPQLIQSAFTLNDKSEFLRQFPEAHLVHFAGHGYYDGVHPEQSGLQFNGGVMKPQELTMVAGGAPIIFSNACETGLLGSVEDAGGGRAWSGLASAFISHGASNYLGSLRAIFDESSSRFAQLFYKLLVGGHTIGEALLQARLQAYESKDLIWEAYVLFGCPRNRLRVKTGIR